jgi:hypothetical protein
MSKLDMSKPVFTRGCTGDYGEVILHLHHRTKVITSFGLRHSGRSRTRPALDGSRFVFDHEEDLAALIAVFNTHRICRCITFEGFLFTYGAHKPGPT